MFHCDPFTFRQLGNLTYPTYLFLPFSELKYVHVQQAISLLVASYTLLEKRQLPLIKLADNKSTIGRSSQTKIIRLSLRLSQVIPSQLRIVDKQLSSSLKGFCHYQIISIRKEYQRKLNENYVPFLHGISRFEGTSYKNL